jgi:aspartate/methionine/tyrosine aminotransferase
MRHLFDDSAVDREVLRERAFNHRWAEQPADVIPLTAADPDFPAPQAVRDAIIEYAQAGYFSYGPPAGLPDFRETIADVMRARKGIPVPAAHVLPIDSAARAMFLMAETVLGPGDEAIIFDPVDFLFKRSVEAAGAMPVFCPIDPATGEFDFDRLESLVTPRTRMLGVCNSHNPVGRVLRENEIRLLAEFAHRHDLWVMNDEIWSDIVYEDDDDVRFHSMHALDPALTRKTVTIYGFSKTFAMAGLRAAFMLCPNETTYRRFLDASQMPATAGGLAPIVQVAATAALRDGWEWVDAFVRHLRDQRDYALRRLSVMDGIRCLRPEGTYVLFPDITALGLPSQDLVNTLREDARVALVPGTPAFFGPGGEGHIRICFATSHEILSEGLDRIENWITNEKEKI